MVPRVTDAAGPGRKRVGFFGAYRKLWAEIRGEWKRDHNVVYYLVASARVPRRAGRSVRVRSRAGGERLRDLRGADVLLFGISACAVAAFGRCHRWPAR